MEGLIMRKMQKLVALILIFTLFTALALSGCGASKETDKSTTKAPESNQASDAQKDQPKEESRNKVTKIKLMAPNFTIGAEQSKADFNKKIENFKAKNNGVEVETDMIPWEQVISKFPISFAANESPDVLMINDLALRSNILNNRFYALNDFIPKETLDDWMPIFMNTIALDGKVYAYMRNTDVRIMFYNKDLFRKAGLDPEKPPVTWEEWMEYAKLTTKVAGQDQYGFGFIGSKTVHTPMMWNILVHQQGTDITDKDGKATYDNAASVKAAQLFADFINKGYAPKAVLGMDDQALQRSFIAGKLAMIINGSWAWAAFKNANMNMDNVGWCKIPRPADGKFATISGFWSYCISSQAKDPKLAFDLLSEFTNEEIIKDEIVKTRELMIPTRKSWTTLPKVQDDPLIKGWTEHCMADAAPSLVAKYPLEVYDTLNLALQKVWSGEPVEETLRKASDEFNQKYAK